MVRKGLTSGGTTISTWSSAAVNNGRIRWIASSGAFTLVRLCRRLIRMDTVHMCPFSKNLNISLTLRCKSLDAIPACIVTSLICDEAAFEPLLLFLDLALWYAIPFMLLIVTTGTSWSIDTSTKSFCCSIDILIASDNVMTMGLCCGGSAFVDVVVVVGSFSMAFWSLTNNGSGTTRTWMPSAVILLLWFPLFDGVVPPFWCCCFKFFIICVTSRSLASTFNAAARWLFLDFWFCLLLVVGVGAIGLQLRTLGGGISGFGGNSNEVISSTLILLKYSS